ncbi:phosphatidate cytidylyltransferase [candidate division FCPU426 bacterium]|nr:phosphatidate cytidylyltransferase [candidate division FCPU426 bacterium]
MTDVLVIKQILTLIGVILGGFGIIVVIISLVFKLRGKDPKSVWIKYLAWFIVIPVIVLPLLYSRIAYQIIILILSLWCFREYSRSTGLWKDKTLVFVSLGAIAAIYMPVFDNWYGLYQAMPIYAVALLLILPILRGKYEQMVQKTCLSVLGVVYFGWFLSHVGFMRNYAHGVQYIFYLMVLVESNDAFGYIWGSLFGKHKLVPLISPNKTIEGAAGALVSVVGMAFALRFLVPMISVWHVLILGMMISLVGMCGDLVISFIKRDLGIKDMGAVIPGHGGILDRFDSLLFTAPLYFHFVRYFYE